MKKTTKVASKKNVPAVRKTSSTAVSVSEADFESAPTGLQFVKASDLALPRITILQGLSPQLQKSKPEYIKDASIGDICDVSSRTLFDEILYLPCVFATVYLEWMPNRGGFAGNHGLDASIMSKTTRDKATGKNVLDNGNIIQPTPTYWGLNGSDDWKRTFIPFGLSGIKKSKDWLGLIKGLKVPHSKGGEWNPPMFYAIYKGEVVDDHNEKGEWKGWQWSFDSFLKDHENFAELFKEAKAFASDADMLVGRTDFSSMASDSSGGDAGGGGDNEAM